MRVIELAWVMLACLHARVDAALAAARVRGTAQSTVEYALVGALVVIAAAGALTLLGDQVTAVFSKISNTLSGAASH
jgi:Flp pilus assembly pilin Flp